MVLMSALKTQVSTHHYISKDDLVPLSALKKHVSTHHYIRKDDLVPLSALKRQVSTYHYIRKDNFNYSVIVWTVWFLVLLCLLGCRHFFQGQVPKRDFAWQGSQITSDLILCIIIIIIINWNWSKKKARKKKSWTFKSDVTKKKEKMLARLLCQLRVSTNLFLNQYRVHMRICEHFESRSLYGCFSL